MENRRKTVEENGNDGALDKLYETTNKQESKISRNIVINWLKDKLLLILLMLGVAIGFGLGFGLRQAPKSESLLLWIGMPGELFMRMLKVTLLPLLVSCIIIGASSLDPKSSGKVSIVSLSYIILTNAVGSLLALAVTFAIQPGKDQAIPDDLMSTRPDTRNLMTEDIFADLIRNLFPDNMVSAAIQKSQTVYTPQMFNTVENTTNGLTNVTVEFLKRSVKSTSGSNILGIIIICAALGVAASQLEEESRLFIDFFKAIYAVIAKVLKWIVWLTPIGVASLIAESVLKTERLEETFSSLGYFVLTIVVGLFIHFFIFIPALYFIIMRKNPVNFIIVAMRPVLTGFAPPSSAIAMPEIFRVCDEKLNINKSVSGFTVPLATSINRDGSCYFIAVTAIYIAQVNQDELNAATIIMMALLATIGSLAIPSIPSASVVTLLIILSSLNMEARNIGLIMAVEWFTDRLRTSCNVLSSTLCCVVTNKLCGFANKNIDIETPVIEKIPNPEETRL
ncbi:hypothetical protein LOTGIDRAFT_136803 [Lottia gigantea]|uniref:Amino acid transporter n=1 Tax=Lottia gigantea TaxID=225164 RepID=V4AJ13_LOTGI|nr:hypothetical protein LOTGIDRAFT_136803 [Lottia gigantea]ESP04139.1 hypothetical protein LOTGIDRAFT_136803 [Lottia gigantea]